MKGFALFVAIVVVLLALPLLFVSGEPPAAPPAEGQPWQIESLPDGATRVFGLVPGRSTLDEARNQYGQGAQVALIIAPGESGSVEAYFDTVTTGSVTGKMILTMTTTESQRELMLKRARKAEYMEGTTRKVALGDEDQAAIGQVAIAAISFIPSAQLDEQIVLQRFGMPAERIRSSEHTEHFLYPAKGLDLRLDAKGKELLQYVPPQEFARLRDPLQQAAGKP
jgi:hypothetical protein